MQKVIVDSDLLSDFLKGKDERVAANASHYKGAHTVLSFTTLSAFEILSGLQHLRATTQMDRAEAPFNTNDEILPEKTDYRLAADIVGALRRAGRPIGLVDPTIAACAIRRGFGVATGNVDHFEFIRQVGFAFPLENWRA